MKKSFSVRGYYRVLETGKVVIVPPHMRKGQPAVVQFIIQAGDKVRLVTPGNKLLKNKIGYVRNIKQDGRLRVKIEGKTYIVNPANVAVLDNLHTKRAEEFKALRGESPAYVHAGQTPSVLRSFKRHLKRKQKDALKGISSKNKIAKLRARFEYLRSVLGLMPKENNAAYEKTLERLAALKQKLQSYEGPTKTVDVHTKPKMREIELLLPHNKELESKLLSGKIIRRELLVRETPMQKKVEKVFLDNDVVAVLKERETRAGIEKHRPYIELDSYPERERASYLISQVLGGDYNFVPSTIVKEGHSSLQHYISEGEEVAMFGIEELPLEVKMKLGIFDFITGQQDRHSWNAIYDDQTNKLWAIDNSLALDSVGDFFRSFALMEVRKEIISDELLKPLSKLLDKSVSAILAAHIGKDSVHKMHARVRWLLKEKEFPKFYTRTDDESRLYDMRVTEKSDSEAYSKLVRG